MKVLLSFLVLIFFFTNAQAQEIEATLGGNTSADGFSVKNLSGTTLFRVNGLGNVGIGTTSPFTKLDVFGGAHIGTLSGVIPNPGRLTLSGAFGELDLQDRLSGAYSDEDRWVIYHNDDLLRFFRPSLGDAMVINPSGKVGIGTTSPNYMLEVISGSDNIYATSITNLSTSGHGLEVRVGSVGTEGALDIYNNSFGNIFKVEAGGVVSGNYGTYHAPSDIRLKKEISTIPDALSKVMDLMGVNFKWKDPGKDQSLQMGLIAQEVEKVVPEVVHTADDKMQTKSVEYQYLVGLLIEAVKEQQKQIEDLESKINSIALKELDRESYGYIKTNLNNLKNFYNVMR